MHDALLCSGDSQVGENRLSVQGMKAHICNWERAFRELLFMVILEAKS